MRRFYMMTAVFVGVGLIAACGNKDDALLLPILPQGAQSEASPQVPQEDLTPAPSTGSTGTGSVTVVGGSSATPASAAGSTGGSADSGSADSGSGDSSGSSAAGGDSASGGSASGGSASGGSASGGSASGGSASGGSASGGSAGGGSASGGSASGGSAGGGSAGGGSASGGSAGGDSSSGGSSTSGGSTGDSGDGGSTAGGTTPSAPAGNTSASFTGKDYSHVDGKWYLDGTTAFTYDKNNSIGFSLKNMEAGTYNVTISAKHWVKHDSTQSLPAGFDNYNLMVGVGGSTTEGSVAASSSEYKTITVQVVVPAGDSVVLLSWLNQSCGSESAAVSSGKVAVCHIPPGNPDNKHTIVVGENAVKAHLKHGDTEGACNVCANFALQSVKLERAGDTSLGAYIAGALNTRNMLIAAIIVMLAAAGIAGLRLMGGRRQEA